MDNSLTNDIYNKVQYHNDSLFTGMIKSFRASASSLNLSGADGDVQIGTYIPNKHGFDIRKALTFGIRRLKPKSTGACAQYVREMLEAGGLSTIGHPVAAYKYASFLPAIGFKHIATLVGHDNQANFSNNQAQAGDIAVMAHGTYGHIHMFTGAGKWISDFASNNMWVYPGEGKCYVFRFG